MPDERPSVPRRAQDRGAPPDRVWALLVDLPSWGAWNPTIASVDGEIAIGGTVRLVTAANAKRTFVLKVTEVIPPRRMVWSSGMPLGLFRGSRTFSLAPVADDEGTDFAMTEVYSGALAGVIGRSIPTWARHSSHLPTR